VGIEALQGLTPSSIAQALRAFLTWRTFSATSFAMVSRLVRQDIWPRTLIDVGANIGQFSVTAAHLLGNVTIHCFEPSPGCLPLLKRNTQELANLKIYPLALGESEGTRVLHVNSHSHSSSLLRLAKSHRLAFPRAQEVGAINVSLSTLDKVFGDLELTPPVMLKLDVQGYEAATIRGGTNTLARIDYVVCETSLKPMYDGETLFLDLVDMVESHGFRFMRPVGWLSNPSNGEILQIDALFERKHSPR
jgi:FkbM family methyltransferase